jgi:hypothetical protein
MKEKKGGRERHDAESEFLEGYPIWRSAHCHGAAVVNARSTRSVPIVTFLDTL